MKLENKTTHERKSLPKPEPHIARDNLEVKLATCIFFAFFRIVQESFTRCIPIVRY